MCRSFQDQKHIITIIISQKTLQLHKKISEVSQKMTNKRVSQSNSGLNSTSTLKLIQLIKEISGKEFKKIKIPISRNPRTHQLSYTVTYDFTDEDLRQFQKLAKLKLEIGLKEAIQAVFVWESSRQCI